MALPAHPLPALVLREAESYSSGRAPLLASPYLLFSASG